MYCHMLSVFVFFLTVWVWQALHQGHCIIPTCGTNSKPVANNSFWRSKTQGLWGNFPASLPTQVITRPRLPRGGCKEALPVSNKTVWCKNTGPVSLGMPMVGGFSLYMPKAISIRSLRRLATFLRCGRVRILLMKGSTCMFYFIGGFKKSDIKTRNTAYTSAVPDNP